MADLIKAKGTDQINSVISLSKPDDHLFLICPKQRLKNQSEGEHLVSVHYQLLVPLQLG